MAGGGSSLGDGGSAIAASLAQPGGVTVDASGDIFIVDTVNNRLRQVTNGIITTLVGSGGLSASPTLFQPGGIAIDVFGNLYIADTGNNLIREVTTGGVITTVAGGGSQGYYGDTGAATAAALAQPAGVAVDGAGNVFIADTLNNVIRKVAITNGNITTVAGNNIQGFSGDGGPATSAELNTPTGVAVDAAGNLYIADKYNNRIREVSGASGTITTIAGNGILGSSGDGGQATAAAMYNPAGVAVDSSGNIFVAVNLSNRIREISGGIITTVAGNGNALFSGDGGPATAASLFHPGGVFVDISGNIFIADTGNNRIRKVSASTVSTPAITPGGIVPVYSTATTIQPGEWVSIYGTNLSSSTAVWTGNFPQSLGGTSVTIDGNAAFLWSVSPGQINLQAPDDISTGPVAVVIRSANGNGTATVTLGQFAPSFLLLDSKHVAGIILRSNGSGAYGGGTYDILGPTGKSLGYATVAAKAGDVVELYGTGFGPTSPEVPAGQPLTSPAPATSQVGLFVNQVSVIPSFAGLSGPGLDQVNITVPAGLGTGDVPLLVTVGGVQTQTGVVISLQ